MGKQYHSLDLDGAIERVVSCAEDAVGAHEDDFPHDEIGRLGDALMWLDIVKNNRLQLGEGDGY